tara:strand:- start:835 stop:1023 length:189 start_codon:yes stop_codon:yes gene_type:complete
MSYLALITSLIRKIVMAKWRFDMICRDEYKLLMAEIERLKAENKELRDEVEKFKRKTAGIYE